MRVDRMTTPASRHPCRVAQARARAVSIAPSSASGKEASSRPVAGSMDFSTPSNHATISFVARASVKRRVAPLDAPAQAPPPQADGRRRVVVERVMPEIDAGRFPAKRATGETVTVEADIFADGHDVLAAVLKYRLLPIHGEVAPQAPEGLSWTEL